MINEHLVIFSLMTKKGNESKEHIKKGSKGYQACKIFKKVHWLRKVIKKTYRVLRLANLS